MMSKVLTIGACSASEPATVPRKGDGGKAQIDALIRSIKAGYVERVELFGVSINADFRVNVTPERLENWWDYRLVVRHLESRAEDFESALTSATVRGSA